MPTKLFWFPTPLDSKCELTHDSDGVVRLAVPDVHPSGRTGQAWILPDTLPDKNGAKLVISHSDKVSLNTRGVLDLHYFDRFTSALLVDDATLSDSNASIPFDQVSIVGDHFEINGKRWPWRMMTGFLDYKVFLDGGDLRSLLKQSQDLGCHGRRVLPHIVNIIDFNPDNYGDNYYNRLPEYLSINAEYEQYVDFPVLSDTGYRGWSLPKCRDFWARFCDSTRSNFNKFINLTNEFDHGGNLVGNPNDYQRPTGILVSQGSAVQDSTPPSPGWDYREWHSPNDLTHMSHEYYIWKGLSTGGTPKPTVISEQPKMDENSANEDIIRTIAYASLANGCGLTVHTLDGEYSRILGPRQSSVVKTAMDILNNSL